MLCIELVLYANASTQWVPYCSICVFIHVGCYQCFAKNQYGMAMSQISSVQQTLLGSFPTRQDPFDYVLNHGDKLTVSMQ